MRAPAAISMSFSAILVASSAADILALLMRFCSLRLPASVGGREMNVRRKSVVELTEQDKEVRVRNKL